MNLQYMTNIKPMHSAHHMKIGEKNTKPIGTNIDIILTD